MRRAHFNGQPWPVPGVGLDDGRFLLRLQGATMLRRDREAIRDVVGAYWNLVWMPERERRKVIAGIRKAARNGTGKRPTQGAGE